MTITIKHLDNGFKHTFNTVISAEKFLNMSLRSAIRRLRYKDYEFYNHDKVIHLRKNHYKTNFVISYD